MQETWRKANDFKSFRAENLRLSFAIILNSKSSSSLEFRYKRQERTKERTSRWRSGHRRSRWKRLQYAMHHKPGIRENAIKRDTSPSIRRTRLRKGKKSRESATPLSLFVLPFSPLFSIRNSSDDFAANAKQYNGRAWKPQNRFALGARVTKRWCHPRHVQKKDLPRARDSS